MGNLGRAGYGSTNDGVWPFSYSTCDVGTMPNQTYADRLTPEAARTSGSREYVLSLVARELPGADGRFSQLRRAAELGASFLARFWTFDC